MFNRNSGRLVRPLLLLLTVVAGVPAQAPPPAANGSVSGSVVNSVTNAPVPRAHVSVLVITGNSVQAFSAAADSEGRFTIGKLPAGRLQISADHAGFVSGSMNGVRQLQADEAMKDVKVTLTPTGAISGRVLSAAGGEVQGAIVSLDGSVFGVNQAVSDEKGQFRISGIPAGRYRLVANPAVMPFPPEIRSDGSKEVHEARTYYPDSLIAKAGLRVEVGAGAEVKGIDIRLVQTPIVTVSGKVLDAPAGGKTTVRAVASAAAGGFVQTANHVKADGSYEIWQLDPGKYTVVAISTPAGGGAQRSIQSVPVEIDVQGSDIGKIDLRMVAPFDVTARVGFDDVKSRETQATQGPMKQPVARRMALSPEGQTFVYTQSLYQTVELGQGDSFTVAGLMPGRYRLAANWGVYIKSISVGGAETAGDILDLRSGPPGDVMVTVASVTGEISGVVSDGNGPAAGVTVVAFGQRPMNARSGADGSYRIAGMPPGKYKVIAGDNDVLRQIQFGGNMDDYSGVMEDVDIHADEKVTKALRKVMAEGR